MRSALRLTRSRRPLARSASRLARFAALAAAAFGLLPAVASAADPGRWDSAGRATIPFTYFQGITSDPAGDLYFDGINVGLHRSSAQLAEEGSTANAIPAAVSAAPPAGEGYNHIGDITFNQGRVLLPLECYYPGTPGGGNTCKTAAFGVAGPATLGWDYYVRLDDADIQKAMWVESSADGSELYTPGGNGSGGASSDLLVYAAADVTLANAATPGPTPDPEISPIAAYANVLPPGQMTGAAVFGGRLYVATSVGNGAGNPDTFKVFSLDPNAGNAAAVLASRRLEIERTVAGESEGLDVNGALGGVLHWQVMPVPSSAQRPTYTPGRGSLLSFVPAAADIQDADGDGVTDGAEGSDGSGSCVSRPGGDQLDGCPSGPAPGNDPDRDAIATAADNCPAVADNFQANADQDGQGDVCDPDDDNDGVADGGDNCQFVANADQANADGDARGDACEDDDDDDGVPDYYDNCPLVANPDQADADGDGIGDACEAVTPPPVDTTPPDTTIGKVKVKGRVATIIFASTDPTGGSYSCELDRKDLKGECGSPLKLKRLKPGRHRFEVAAVDPAGNADPSPAKATFRIKRAKKPKRG